MGNWVNCLAGFKEIGYRNLLQGNKINAETMFKSVRGKYLFSNKDTFCDVLVSLMFILNRTFFFGNIITMSFSTKIYTFYSV